MENRLCRKCRAPLAVDQDICQVCGTRNPIPLPWYTYPLGLLILAAIGYFLIDWRALVAYFS